MNLTRMSEEEKKDVKSMIGNFDGNSLILDVRLGNGRNGERREHDWSYVGIRFTNDATHMDILRFICKCHCDEFIGVFNNFYVLWFD